MSFGIGEGGYPLDYIREAEDRHLNEIVNHFAELLSQEQHYGKEANDLITEYATLTGQSEHDADLELHAKADGHFSTKTGL